MPRTSIYDVIVVGSDATGLMVAGLVRRQNHRVLLLGQGMVGAHYQHDGVRIPSVPTMIPPYGHAPVLDDVLQSLGVEDPVHTLGSADNTPLQVVTPEQRVTLFSEPERLAAELRRAMPSETPGILKVIGSLKASESAFRTFLDASPPLAPEGFRDRARLKRMLRSIQEHPAGNPAGWPPLLRILAGATTFLSGLGQHTRSLHATGHLVLALLSGPRIVTGLRDLLIAALQRNGTDVELRTVAEEIQFDGKMATGVTTLRSSSTYGCSVLLTSVPVREALELIPLRNRHRRFSLSADSVRTSESLFVVNLLIPKECLPLGMGSNLLLVRRLQDAFVEDNLIRVHVLPHPARNDSVLLSLSCLVPYRKRTLGREYLGPLHSRLVTAARWLVPFLDDHLQGQSSPFWESRADDEGHPAPWSIHQVFETEQDVALGSALVPLRTPYRNLFHCGPEAMPGLGAEGAAFAAREAARLVTEKSGLKKIL